MKVTINQHPLHREEISHDTQFLNLATYLAFAYYLCSGRIVYEPNYQPASYSPWPGCPLWPGHTPALCEFC